MGVHPGAAGSWWLDNSAPDWLFGSNKILKLEKWVEDQTIEDPLMQRERPADRADVVSLNKRQQAHRLARRDELLGHFQGQRATEAVTAKHVGAMRLDLSDLVDIALRDMFELTIDRRTPIETGGLQTEDGLIGAEMSCQRPIAQDVAVGGVHQEQMAADHQTD